LRTAFICVALAAVAAPALGQPARPITIGEFVAKAEPLMKKSMASLMFSSEAKGLMRELGAAAEATRAQQEADRTAGRKSATCLPPKGKAKVDARELIAHLKVLPPADKARSFRWGFVNYAAIKYPCPKV
jgi:hypothetical protein